MSSSSSSEFVNFDWDEPDEPYLDPIYKPRSKRPAQDIFRSYSDEDDEEEEEVKTKIPLSQLVYNSASSHPASIVPRRPKRKPTKPKVAAEPELKVLTFMPLILFFAHIDTPTDVMYIVRETDSPIDMFRWPIRCLLANNYLILRMIQQGVCNEKESILNTTNCTNVRFIGIDVVKSIGANCNGRSSAFFSAARFGNIFYKLLNHQVRIVGPADMENTLSYRQLVMFHPKDDDSLPRLRPFTTFVDALTDKIITRHGQRAVIHGAKRCYISEKPIDGMNGDADYQIKQQYHAPPHSTFKFPLPDFRNQHLISRRLAIRYNNKVIVNNITSMQYLEPRKKAKVGTGATRHNLALMGEQVVFTVDELYKATNFAHVQYIHFTVKGTEYNIHIDIDKLDRDNSVFVRECDVPPIFDRLLYTAAEYILNMEDAVYGVWCDPKNVLYEYLEEITQSNHQNSSSSTAKKRMNFVGSKKKKRALQSNDETDTIESTAHRYQHADISDFSTSKRVRQGSTKPPEPHADVKIDAIKSLINVMEYDDKLKVFETEFRKRHAFLLDALYLPESQQKPQVIRGFSDAYINLVNQFLKENDGTKYTEHSNVIEAVNQAKLLLGQLRHRNTEHKLDILMKSAAVIEMIIHALRGTYREQARVDRYRNAQETFLPLHPLHYQSKVKLQNNKHNSSSDSSDDE